MQNEEHFAVGGDAGPTELHGIGITRPDTNARREGRTFAPHVGNHPLRELPTEKRREARMAQAMTEHAATATQVRSLDDHETEFRHDGRAT